jgi:peptidyl-prolyl cis-trans isomerase C
MLLLVAALQMLAANASGKVSAAADNAAGANIDSDVIAKVGDQPITFTEINTALNSSAIVGMSVPALGTPQRDTARIILLDRFVSANLIYLDAIDNGADKEPAYRRAMKRFSNAILAGLYRKQRQAGDIQVSDAEVEAYFKQHMKTDAGLTDDIRLQIASSLRRKKLHERLVEAQKTLRDDIEVNLYPENLDSDGDQTRQDETPLAKVGDEVITWGELKDRIIGAGRGALKVDLMADGDAARRQALEHEIDLRIMVQKAKAAGLDKDKVYSRRMQEFGKTLLTNRYREKLIKEMAPSLEALKAYYEANKSRLVIPEARKLHMIVVKTREQAEDLKDRIESGELTMYQAARDYSTAANAKKDLGDVGWVNRGEMAPELNEMIFSLGRGEIGGPVESPAGWHLVRVQDVREAKFTDFADSATQKLVRRRYLKEKLDKYTAALRKDRFTVEVYKDRLLGMAQKEADMVKRLAEKAKQPGSVTKRRIEEMEKQFKPAR